MSGPGCIFEHYGHIPEAIYMVERHSSPLEEAVYNNDLAAFMKAKEVNCLHLNSNKMWYMIDIWEF